MNTPIPSHVREYLRRIANDAGFQDFVSYLRVELEDAKTSLVDVPPERVQKLQGYARGIREVVELVDPKPATKPATKTHP